MHYESQDKVSASCMHLFGACGVRISLFHLICRELCGCVMKVLNGSDEYNQIVMDNKNYQVSDEKIPS